MRQQPIQLTGDPAEDVVILAARLAEPAAAEVEELCEMLAAIPGPRAGAALRGLVAHESAHLRAAATRALGSRLAEPETVSRRYTDTSRRLPDSWPFDRKFGRWSTLKTWPAICSFIGA